MKRLLSGLAASALIALPPVASAATSHWKWAITVHPDAVVIGEAEDDESNQISCDLPAKQLITFHYHVDGVTLDKQVRTKMTITSGAATVTAASDGDPNEDEGGADVIALVPAGSPVVSAFAATGALKMTALGHTSSSPSVPAAMAARLVKLCRG